MITEQNLLNGCGNTFLDKFNSTEKTAIYLTCGKEGYLCPNCRNLIKGYQIAKKRIKQIINNLSLMPLNGSREMIVNVNDLLREIS